MIKVTLKDGSVKEFPAGISAYEAAKEISTGLARNACAAKINGKNADLMMNTANGHSATQRHTLWRRR